MAHLKSKCFACHEYKNMDCSGEYSETEKDPTCYRFWPNVKHLKTAPCCGNCTHRKSYGNTNNFEKCEKLGIYVHTTEHCSAHELSDNKVRGVQSQAKQMFNEERTDRRR